MKVFKAKVRISRSDILAFHIVEVRPGCTGTVHMNFIKIHCITDHEEDEVLQKVRDTSFARELIKTGRADLCAKIQEDQYSEFIILTLRQTYGDHAWVELSEMEL